MKQKTQSSLLSFFSPPSSEGASAKKKNAPAAAASSSNKKAATKAQNKRESLGNTRKKIEFSPKLKQKPAEKESNNVDMEDADKTESVGTKRKAYEKFLGTSSEEDEPVTTNKKTQDKEETKKRTQVRLGKVIIQDDSDSEEEAVAPPSSRRRKGKTTARNVVSSEEEWEQDSPEEGENGEESEFSGAEEEPSDDDEVDDLVEEESEEEAPPSKKRRKSAPAATKSKKVPAKSFLSPPPAAKKKWNGTPTSSSKKSAPLADGPDLPSSVAGAGNHIHDSLPWLHEQRRDINGNTPDSPDYDPRTLKVPQEFIKKETPAMVQWWEVKAQNMDTVLFFKVGKFYELFHMDADVGFKELNLIYMKGDKAHSGFPEIAYSKMSSQLVEKGYRVARVEQTETPDMLKERNSKLAKKAKVVRREVCSLLSIGTNTISFLDAPISSQNRVSKYLLALKEATDPTQKTVRFGVCLADAATGAFQLSEFDETEQRDRLKTLFAQFHVVEIVTERFNISDDTKMVLKHAAPAAIRSSLRVGKEFWDASKTVDEIERAGYFKEHGWPEDVLYFLEMDKAVKADGQLAISALGGCIWHLRRSIIDQELLSLCNFRRYKPSDEEARDARANRALSAAKSELNQQYVVLDSQTIQNLEVLTNSFNGTRSGSLIDIMDKTVTSFGRRMFQEWVLKPLCKIGDIQERLDAVEELGNSGDLMMEIREILRKLPDLERLLSRIHALGSSHRSKDHPDSRAIMYESQTYNLRKIRDFLAVLDGFDAAMNLAQELGPRLSQSTSPILQSLLKRYQIEDGVKPDINHGHFPDLTEKLEFFKRSFDQISAQKSGVIVPQAGVDPEYDVACAEITQIEDELDEYLQEQQTSLRCRQIKYWSTKKKEDRYQLEVPESALLKQPKEFELKSRKKGYKRFHTPTIRSMLKRLATAEDHKDEALKDQTRRIFHKFDEDYKYWMKAVQCLAVIDCLVSLALLSSQSEGYTKPEVVAASTGNGGTPFIDIEEGVHPCVAATYSSGDFIPNDVHLGLEGKGNMVLLSGPNMGGKSTLLRQTCVLTLMAQIGSFVPAAKCRLSPVDRIFTRIGASDRILAGQSTLYVELAETATILNHATNHSLVILDELGRGTSTFDGTAIAYSVVEHLLNDIQCRAMFATHYHSLVEEYAGYDKVSLGHMGCIVDPENDRKVTFLYKLEDGMCPKSYGLNVAMLAKLPDEVIECAAKKSEQFERSLQANSHTELETLRVTQKVKEALAEGEAGVDKLKQLWAEVRGAIRA